MVVWSIGVPKLSARRVGETKTAHTCRQVPSPGLLDLVEERLDGIDRRPSPLTDFLPSPCDLSEFGFTSSARRACLSNSRPLQTKGTLSMFMINMSALLATIGNHAEMHDFTWSVYLHSQVPRGFTTVRCFTTIRSTLGIDLQQTFHLPYSVIFQLN
jgi:hypothetical protein